MGPRGTMGRPSGKPGLVAKGGLTRSLAPPKSGPRNPLVPRPRLVKTPYSRNGPSGGLPKGGASDGLAHRPWSGIGNRLPDGVSGDSLRDVGNRVAVGRANLRTGGGTGRCLGAGLVFHHAARFAFIFLPDPDNQVLSDPGFVL